MVLKPHRYLSQGRILLLLCFLQWQEAYLANLIINRLNLMPRTETRRRAKLIAFLVYIQSLMLRCLLNHQNPFLGLQLKWVHCSVNLSPPKHQINRFSVQKLKPAHCFQRFNLQPLLLEILRHQHQYQICLAAMNLLHCLCLGALKPLLLHYLETKRNQRKRLRNPSKRMLPLQLVIVHFHLLYLVLLVYLDHKVPQNRHKNLLN